MPRCLRCLFEAHAARTPENAQDSSCYSAGEGASRGDYTYGTTRPQCRNCRKSYARHRVSRGRDWVCLGSECFSHRAKGSLLSPVQPHLPVGHLLPCPEASQHNQQVLSPTSRVRNIPLTIGVFSCKERQILTWNFVDQNVAVPQWRVVHTSGLTTELLRATASEVHKFHEGRTAFRFPE